jgi:putative addiction module component (TIGR02574 family)
VAEENNRGVEADIGEVSLIGVLLGKADSAEDNLTMSVTAIQNEVLNLSAIDRARLIDLIWESLSEPEIKTRETSWAAESERRIDAYENGKLMARDAADVFADLKENLRK